MSSPGAHGLRFLDITKGPDGHHQAVPLAVGCLDSVRTDEGLKYPRSPFWRCCLMKDGMYVHGLCSHQPVPLQPPAHHTTYLSSGGGSLSSVHPVHTCGWHFPPASAFLCSCNAQRTPLCSCLQTSGHEVESQDGHRTPLWEESKPLSSVRHRPPSLHICLLWEARNGWKPWYLWE